MIFTTRPYRDDMVTLLSAMIPVDCVVADAVDLEPVSASKFPANREKNREFHRIRLPGCDFESRHASKFRGFQRNSLSTEQGIISPEHGIMIQEQGIFPIKTEIIFGRDIRYATLRMEFSEGTGSIATIGIGHTVA